MTKLSLALLVVGLLVFRLAQIEHDPGVVLGLIAMFTGSVGLVVEVIGKLRRC